MYDEDGDEVGTWDNKSKQINFFKSNADVEELSQVSYDDDDDDELIE